MWAMITSVLMAGTQRFVAAGLGALVLDEIARLEHLADVVEIGAHADQQAAGADALGGRLGDRAHGDRVGVGARARRTSSCSSGWVTSPSSSRLRSVSTPKPLLDEGQQSGHDEAGGHGPHAGPGGVAQQGQRPAADCRSRRSTTSSSDGHAAGDQADVDQLAAAADAAPG